jgi:hypothetical protein
LDFVSCFDWCNSCWHLHHLAPRSITSPVILLPCHDLRHRPTYSDTPAPTSRTLCKQRRLYCNGSVDLRRLDAREAHLFFDSFLFADKLVAPNSQDVVARFGSSSGTYLALSPILRDLWERAKDDSSVQTKFAEWNRLLAKVYGSEIGNDDLFLRHT